MKHQYCETLYQAAMRNHENLFAEGCIYNGKEGCLRLAREYGAGLAELSENEAKDELQSSYGTLCVRAYLLRPPVDAKEWINEAKKGIERMRINYG